MTAVVCRREQALTVDEFRQVLLESGLGATRPVDDPARLGQMLAAAGLVMTARASDGRLLGVARCLSDGAWADNPRIKIGCYAVRVEGDEVQVQV